MIRVFESHSGQARLQAATAFVRSYPPATELLLVGVSRESLDDLVREVAAHSPTFGLHRFGFLQLVSHCGAGELATVGLAPATSLGMEAVAARAAFEALDRGEIPRFARVCRFPGFPRALASTLHDLRMAGVDANALADEFVALLRHYADGLERGAIADHAAMLRAARRGLDSDAHAAFRRMPTLLLDLPIDSPLEREFLRGVCETAPAVLATLASGDGTTAESLQGLGAEWHAEPPATNGNSLTRLRTHLFSDAVPSGGRADEQVRFFSAPGEGRECIEIAREILSEVERGTALDAMAVFVRSPDAYSSFLDTAFRRARIPAYFARGTKRPDPAGRAFLALLACRSEGLSARRFAEYLSFGQLPSLDANGAPPASREVWSAPQNDLLGATLAPATLRGKGVLAQPQQLSLFDFEETADDCAESTDSDSEPTLEGALRTPWKWEELLVEASVIGGNERWRRRLSGLERELRLKIEALRDVEPESPRLAALERDLVNLGHLERFALPLIDALDTYPKSATWGDWVARLSALAPRVLRRPERVLSVLAEMQPMAEVGPVSVDEVREVLTDRLSTLEIDPPESRYGRVFVATPEQARGRSFKVVFVPGLAERVFPQRPREDPLLLDSLRQRISTALRTQAERSQEERMLLRLALSAAEERVVLSYPRLDAVEARPRVPSFYALDMARAIGGSIPDYEELEREAAERAQARLAWPAPPEAAQAVDAVEHDLAILGSFLHSSEPDAARGRARYLLALSPHLARSLRARWLRWRPEWRPQDGLVRTTEATRSLMTSQRLRARPYSVTALQKFAACPYRFFLAAIHRLEPRQDAIALVQLDPLTRGRMFHHIQADTLRTLQRAGGLPLRPDAFDEARFVLDATIERLAPAYGEDLAPAIPRIWEDEVETMRADLRMWLRSIAADAWQPRHFEFTFGLPLETTPSATASASPLHPQPTRDASSIADAATLPGGWRLRGAVDVIEERASDGALRVTDNKTGSNRTREGMIVGGGEFLQPVLYALAVQEMLQRPVAEGRLFFCSARGSFADRVVPLSDFARLYGNRVLEIIDASIERGFLPPAPKRGACRHCDFRAVCGPNEEIRSERKSTALAHLEDLRSLP
ncbi:MAG: exodeoxyribonuclease V subunit gamma [Candidatus Latescibacterota bacterium]|nr:MAG: exodeoxyribonuclease V subunit gamma [Candidatus Latescibacterota bacterium]